MSLFDEVHEKHIKYSPTLSSNIISKIKSNALNGSCNFNSLSSVDVELLKKQGFSVSSSGTREDPYYLVSWKLKPENENRNV